VTPLSPTTDAPTGKLTITLGPVGLAVLAAVALLLTYAVVVIEPFAVTDDYYVLSKELKGLGLDTSDAAYRQVIRGEPTLVSSLARGCVTSAVLTSLAFRAAGSVAGLRWVRLIGLLGIALVAAMLIRAMTRAGWPPWLAALAAFLMCTIPAFQVCASWAIAFSAFYSCAATGLAVELALRALDAGAPRRRRLWALAGALGALLFAATIYQVTLLYFVVFGAIHVFRPGTEAARDVRSVVGLTLVLGAGLVMGYVAYRIGLALYGRWMPVARTRLVSDYWGKLDYALHGPFRDAFQLGILRPTAYLAAGFALLIGGGMYLYFAGSWKSRLLRVGLAVLLVPGAYLPNLLTNENWGAYRTQLAIAPLAMLYAMIAAQGYARAAGAHGARVLRVLAPAAALWAGLQAAHNVTRFYAEPQMVEIRVIRNQLSRVNLDTIQKVHVAGAPWTTALNGVRYDEFGLPSTAQAWSAPAMVWVLAYEKLGHAPKFPVVLSAPRQPPKNEYLVNLSRFDLYQ